MENGRRRRSCLELHLVLLKRKERRKMQQEKKGIFWYLPKSTLTGLTGLDSRFSLLSCRVSSWDSLLLVSSPKIPNQMRRVPPFFSPIQNGLKNEEYRVFKRDLELSQLLDLGVRTTLISLPFFPLFLSFLFWILLNGLDLPACSWPQSR